MNLSYLKSLLAVVTLAVAGVSTAVADSNETVAQKLVGTWFVDVTGVLPDGGAYQNIMNVDEGGTADIFGGFMFGASGIKFTDSPASLVSTNGNEFTINMFAFLNDVETGAPNALNVTVYRGTMNENGTEFTAEADLYYLPCTIGNCPAPDPQNLGAPATIAMVTGVKIAEPIQLAN